jgi:hypothetical protein
MMIIRLVGFWYKKRTGVHFIEGGWGLRMLLLFHPGFMVFTQNPVLAMTWGVMMADTIRGPKAETPAF